MNLIEIYFLFVLLSPIWLFSIGNNLKQEFEKLGYSAEGKVISEMTWIISVSLVLISSFFFLVNSDKKIFNLVSYEVIPWKWIILILSGIFALVFAMPKAMEIRDPLDSSDAKLLAAWHHSSRWLGYFSGAMIFLGVCAI